MYALEVQKIKRKGDLKCSRICEWSNTQWGPAQLSHTGVQTIKRSIRESVKCRRSKNIHTGVNWFSQLGCSKNGMGYLWNNPLLDTELGVTKSLQENQGPVTRTRWQGVGKPAPQSTRQPTFDNLFLMATHIQVLSKDDAGRRLDEAIWLLTLSQAQIPGLSTAP